MTTVVRGATTDEYPDVRTILESAFHSDDEARLWDYLVEHDPSLRPEGVRLAVVDGRPVACTVVLPRDIRGRVGWVAGAIVTLVACLPAMQGRGHGGRTVRDALTHMEEQGWALGILYGHPTYYPRFGFVPTMPSCHTVVPASAAQASGDTLSDVRDGELSMLAELYAASLGEYPCAVARDAAPWLWRARNSERGHLLALSGRRAYSFVSEDRDAGDLVIHEAAADESDVVALLAALLSHAERSALVRVRLVMPPRHPLVALAVERGAAQRISPPSAGMAAIVDPDALLPPGYWLDDDDLLHGVRRIGRIDRQSLAPYILGARGLDENPSAWPIDDLSAEVDRDRLAADWPASFPHWSLEPFWT